LIRHAPVTRRSWKDTNVQRTANNATFGRFPIHSSTHTCKTTGTPETVQEDTEFKIAKKCIAREPRMYQTSRTHKKSNKCSIHIHRPSWMCSSDACICRSRAMPAREKKRSSLAANLATNCTQMKRAFSGRLSRNHNSFMKVLAQEVGVAQCRRTVQSAWYAARRLSTCSQTSCS